MTSKSSPAASSRCNKRTATMGVGSAMAAAIIIVSIVAAVVLAFLYDQTAIAGATIALIVWCGGVWVFHRYQSSTGSQAVASEELRLP